MNTKLYNQHPHVEVCRVDAGMLPLILTVLNRDYAWGTRIPLQDF